jgi:hypothetical protein
MSLSGESGSRVVTTTARDKHAIMPVSPSIIAVYLGSTVAVVSLLEIKYTVHTSRLPYRSESRLLASSITPHPLPLHLTSSRLDSIRLQHDEEKSPFHRHNPFSSFLLQLAGEPHKRGQSAELLLRLRKSKAFWRSHRCKPAGA